MDCLEMNEPAGKESTVIGKLLSDEEGQDVIEWGLLAAFLGIGVIAASTLTGLGGTISGWYVDEVIPVITGHQK